MATCYFLCGGPFELTQPIESLFPGFHVVPDKSDSVWSLCDDHEIVYTIVDGFWIVNGDSNDVFRLGPHFCKQVSANGEAGEFYAQRTSDYYEIVLYRDGAETKRFFSFEDGPGERKNVTLAELDTEDMWTYSSKILPVPWDEIYDRPGVWLRKDGYENSRGEQGGDAKRGWRRWFASLWRG